MAKNLKSKETVQSDIESSEEEEDATSSEKVGSSESDTEPEQAQIAIKSSSLPVAAFKKSQPQSSSKTQKKQSPPSSDEEESGSESDEPDPNVKHIASKPVDDPQKSDGARKPKSKPSVSEPFTQIKSTGAKRLAEEKESGAKDAKRSKKKPTEPELENSEKKPDDDSRKQLFQRLWSEDDEIAILKGMIDYAEKKKSDPVADLSAFHGFIKDNLHVDVSRTQLQDKIRRLKKKYENNKSKEKEGKDRIFSKPHEQKAYELSKHIWGNENGKGSGGEKIVGSPELNGSVARKTQSQGTNAVENGASVDVKSVGVAKGHLDKASKIAKIMGSNAMGLEEMMLGIGGELFEGDERVEGEREWQKLKIQEMEVYLKKLELMRAQTKLVLDVLKSTDH